MPTLTLTARFDGKRLQLDEPCDLPRDVPLRVTVLIPEPDDDRAAWIEVGRQTLARAYSDDEPEYTIADLRP